MHSNYVSVDTLSYYKSYLANEAVTRDFAKFALHRYPNIKAIENSAYQA